MNADRQTRHDEICRALFSALGVKPARDGASVEASQLSDPMQSVKVVGLGKIVDVRRAGSMWIIARLDLAKCREEKVMVTRRGRSSSSPISGADRIVSLTRAYHSELGPIAAPQRLPLDPENETEIVRNHRVAKHALRLARQLQRVVRSGSANQAIY